MSSILLHSHYFPCIAYFSAIQSHPTCDICIDVHAHYEKQSYRNRCHILMSNGLHALIVPIQHIHKKIIFKDIKIDYRQQWMHVHWRSICSAYGKSPFFIHYEEAIRQILYKKSIFLLDLNIAILLFCFEQLGIKRSIQLSHAYLDIPMPCDYRNYIHPKRSLLMPDSFYIPSSYSQLFSGTFIPNLSVLDVLFCEGGRCSLEIINQSIK